MVIRSAYYFYIIAGDDFGRTNGCTHSNAGRHDRIEMMAALLKQELSALELSQLPML
jgi:hypothetical protein